MGENPSKYEKRDDPFRSEKIASKSSKSISKSYQQLKIYFVVIKEYRYSDNKYDKTRINKYKPKILKIPSTNILKL